MMSPILNGTASFKNTVTVFAGAVMPSAGFGPSRIV
jgi:hypothetical protein